MQLKNILFIASLALISCCEEEEVITPPVYDPPLTNELILSEIRNTSIEEADGFRNTFVEIYNGTGQTIDLSNYGLWYSSNGSNGVWDPSTQLTFSGTLDHGKVIIIVREGTNATIFPFPDYVWADLKANGDDAIALIKDEGSGFRVIDQYGAPYTEANDPGGAWDIAGIEDGSKDYVLWRKWQIENPNVDWFQSAGTSEIGSEWIVVSQDDFSNVGTYTPDIAEFEPEAPTIIPPVTSELIVSEVRITSTSEDGDHRNTYIEIYNGTEAVVDLSNYAVQYASNGNSGAYDPATQLIFTGMLEHGEVIVIARDNTDPNLVVNPDYVWSDLTANGDDAVGLFKLVNSTFQLIDQYGEPFDGGNDPGGAWDVAGEVDASKDKVLWRKWEVADPNTDWSDSAGTSTENSEWIVRAKEDYSNLGTFTRQNNYYE